MSRDQRLRLGPRPAEVIDRSAPLRVAIDGTTLSGYDGDTAASLLAAHGRRAFFGSLHEVRPGGVRTADRFDRDGWVWLAGDGLIPAAGHRIAPGDELSAYHDGASASLAAVPLVRWQEAGRAVIEKVMPARDALLTPAWLTALRRTDGCVEAASGLHARADVLVVGGGLAGLAAARAAADEGAQVMLVEADEWLGGYLHWAGGERGRDAVAELARVVASHPSITVVASAVVSECRTDGTAVVVERWGREETVWVVQAAAVILATGAVDRRLPFQGNHLPGSMTAAGVRRLVELWAVCPGERAVLVSDQRGHQAMTELAGVLDACGVEVTEVAVLGERAGHLVAEGEQELERVVVPGALAVPADLLVTSFGLTVETALVAGLGGVVTHLPATGELIIGSLPANAAVVGAMAGQSDLHATRSHAQQAARRLSALVLDKARRHRLAPPPPPVVVAQSAASIARPIHGVLEATLDLRVEPLDGFANSRAAATEALVSTARRAGLGGPARVVLADLARSSLEAAPLADLILGSVGPIGGPSLAALGALVDRTLRRSPLIDLHRSAGAQLVPSDGWVDVLHYGVPDDELDALHDGVALRDSTAEGWFRVAGPAAAEVVRRVVGDGATDGVVDDVVTCGDHLVIRLGTDVWQISVPSGMASTFEAALLGARLDHQPWEVVAMADNDQHARLRICGPATSDLLAAVAVAVPLGRRSAARVGESEVYVVAHDSTDVELHTRASAARAVWASLMVAGERLAVRPVGIDAMERRGGGGR